MGERSEPHRRVLVTDIVFDGIDPERAVLEPLGVEVEMASGTDAATLALEAAGAAGLLVCYAQVSRPVIEAAAPGGLKAIARYGIGYDNVDVEAAAEHGIVVTNVPDYCLDEVADHTMALLLDRVRLVTESVEAVRQGGWDYDGGSVGRLRGRRLALIGLGGIGRRVATRALAFGLEVVAYDPYASAEIEGVARAEDLGSLVAGADVVSIHVPATAENRHLVDAALLAQMKPGAIVINTARGPLLDLEVATAALIEGRLGGLCLDVTEPEPLPQDHPLRTHPRALVTPHMAFHSVEATEELQRRAAGEIARTLNGEPPENPVGKRP